MLKSIISNRDLPALGLGLACLLWLPLPAHAEVFFTLRGLLAEHFKASARVSYVQVKPTKEQRQHIEQRLGRSLVKPDYTFYVATTAGRLDGYALFDEERGQHELISFATFFDAEGRVTDVEVLAYREPYGDSIRGERFRRQFVGRSARSGFTADRDIDAVSGASISSRSMCAGVQRASVLLDEMLLKDKAELASR
jgi:Na+-translocating ferredoxin:NAD+ oxidoreductase RnfG subunit